MKHITFQPLGNSEEYPVAILLKESALKKAMIEKHYIAPLATKGYTENVVAIGAPYDDPKKVKVKTCKEFLAEALPDMVNVGITSILCCDTNYFKVLTGAKKAEPNYGYVLPCVIKDFEHLSVVLAPNHQTLFYAPTNQSKIDMGIHALSTYLDGSYSPPGENIIHSAEYPATDSSIEKALNELHKYPTITADIEGYSLKHWLCGVATIGFAWDQHNGVCFDVDLEECEPYEFEMWVPKDQKYVNKTGYHVHAPNKQRRKFLRDFLESYEGTIIWHGATFDLKVLIYTLYMDHLLDQEGLLRGLEMLTKKFHCTKTITYLATNSCAGNKLGLKDVAQEFAGNWAQDDIKDIRLIEPAKLRQYNLVDCLSTWFAYNKHYSTMVADNQLDLYNGLMMESLVTIIQMELTGMPLNRNKVLKVEKLLQKDLAAYVASLQSLKIIQGFQNKQRLEAMLADNKKWVNKRNTIDAYDGLYINPNSGPQLQSLIYDFLDYEVIDLTKGKQPATGAKTLQKLIHKAKDPEHVKLFQSLIGIGEVSILLNNFIKNFKLAPQANDGWHYLFGNFNLGGTVSGRLSSSGPNLQNIPSHGNPYAKIVKECFEAPPGWLFVGADYASLEDRISALTTKDPMKLKVYTDGYDGHCLRAYSYFGDQMTGIENTVESINSIKKKFEPLRDKSKAPTFLLTYGGTYIGLMQNCGFSEKEAKEIEANYHKMYSWSDKWVQAKLKQATVDGYVTVAFGLRVRTPLLAKTYLGTKSTPYAAEKEGRTAGNALGQSYGLLNSRAGNKTMQQVRVSKYSLDIKPSAQIHDACYFMIRNDIQAVKFLNDTLGTAMSWQELPEIQHPTVKLSGELDIFYPNWSKACNLPNDIDAEEIYARAYKHIKELEHE